MFGFFRNTNKTKNGAGRAYAVIAGQIRQPEFYSGGGVPDTFEGRFELAVLHIFIVMARVLGDSGAPNPRDGKIFNQALFDSAFKNFSISLTQSGVGDMSLSKHMRRMMKAFNGRVHAYTAAAGDDALMRQALRRNLYGTAPDITDPALNAMMSYVHMSRQNLAAQGMDVIMAGDIRFPALPQASGMMEKAA